MNAATHEFVRWTAGERCEALKPDKSSGSFILGATAGPTTSDTNMPASKASLQSGAQLCTS
jgi:hypothetical protein